MTHHLTAEEKQAILEKAEQWASRCRIFIPGGALITGRGPLAEIHRRFS